MATTITLTGRPCHRAEISIEDEEDGPCKVECDCGGRWCDDSTGRSYSEWYWVHLAPGLVTS